MWFCLGGGGVLKNERQGQTKGVFSLSSILCKSFHDMEAVLKFTFVLVAQNPAQRRPSSSMGHRIERREAYHDDFRFAKLEGYGNLTIQVGSTAYLHCPVINLGERPVRRFFKFRE